MQIYFYEPNIKYFEKCFVQHSISYKLNSLMTTYTLTSSFTEIAVAISNDWNRLKQYIQLYFYEPNILCFENFSVLHSISEW